MDSGRKEIRIQTDALPAVPSTDLFGLGVTHPESPKVGDIVACPDRARRLTDPKGYRVETLGWSKGHGVPYGCFAARGVAYGGLYYFSVTEWRLHSLPNDQSEGRAESGTSPKPSTL
jgi:hypothetical protein